MHRPFRSFRLALAVLFLALAGQVAEAATTGALSGTVRDVHGNPLAGLLVYLASEKPADALPFLTRTDEKGRLFFKEIAVGTYELLVKSAFYESPVGRLVHIEAGKTLGIRLVLQQILTLRLSDQPNVGLKSLLRASDDRRLIFRTLPGQLPEDDTNSNRYFRNAVFRLDTNTGWGSPGDSAGGTATNFAVKELMPGGNEYVIAGQIHSGENSLWRIKNFAEYGLGRNHTVQLFLGFSRLSYEQPSFPLLDDPVSYAEDRDHVTNPSAQRILSLGLSDRWQLGDALTVVMGMELNQVRTSQNRYFGNPSAEVRYSPLSGSTFGLQLASKRNTVGNTVTLPDGQRIDLGDAVYLSSLGEQSWLGRARYYQATFSQQIGSSGELELSGFRNHLLGSGIPFLAFSASRNAFDGLQFSDRLADSRGYRFTFRRGFGEHLKAAFSYLRGRAAALTPNSQTFFVASQDIRSLVSSDHYQALVTQVDLFVPHTSTHVTTLAKVVPGANPLFPIDPMSDVYETSNEGVNLFVRQLIPVPASLLGFFGLDFLADYTIEALLDIRNLTNENLGLVHTDNGDLILVQHPRTVRGGIAFKF